MREFFHGWRRKMGCVALVTACALTFEWLRSLADGPESEQLLLPQFNSGKYHFSAWKVASDIVCTIDQSPVGTGTSITVSEFAIPFCALVLPLTLLSAYLILYPGKRKVAQPTQKPT